MSSAFRRGVAITAWLAMAAASAVANERELRVCADPNNLPFSDDRGGGFENRVAEILAQDLGASLTYVWWAQRRGFVRNTLDAGACDLVLGMPTDFERVRTTAPYYRSAYAFVTRAGEPPVRDFDDPRLRDVRVGVQLIGDDGWNTPPAHALSARSIIRNVRGFPVYGDYKDRPPTARIVDAVAEGDIDVAVVWGPLAGWAAACETPPLVVTPIDEASDTTGMPMRFSIGAAVRKSNVRLAGEIDGALARHRDEITRLLKAWRVPMLPLEPAR